MANRYCLALDLKDDPALIEEYKTYHAAGAVWPEIVNSIKDSGIVDMQIYLLGNRLFMIMDVNDEFTFDAKAKADQNNPKVQQWESLMDTFQQTLPWAKNNEKWVLMESIFDLREQ